MEMWSIMDTPSPLPARRDRATSERKRGSRVRGRHRDSKHTERPPHPARTFGPRHPLPASGAREASHAGAPDFTSLKIIESIKAWNEASMMLGETPTVVQRWPASSSLSNNTRAVSYTHLTLPTNREV